MNALIENHKDKIFELCERNHVKSLYLFGSVTDTSRFTEESDIDILVSFKMEEITLEEYTDAYFNLLFNLEDLLGKEIDIITERSVSNPFFKEELENTKVLLFDSLAAANG